MYGNGVRTGMEAIAAVHRPILQALHLALSVFFVAVAGATTQGTAVYRFVTATTQAAGTTTTASALFFSNYNNIPFFCTKPKPR